MASAMTALQFSDQQQQQSNRPNSLSSETEASTTQVQRRSHSDGQQQHLKLRDIPAISYSSSDGEDVFYDTRENITVSPSLSNASEAFEGDSDEK